MATVILGNDSSWTGWGWALTTERGPVAVGHVAGLGDRSWPWAALQVELQVLEGEIVEAMTLLAPGDPLPRLAVEIAPPVYRGRGNQAATGQGLGQFSGALCLWGTRPGRLGYPWELSPSSWRPWWTIRGQRPPKGRIAWKAWACQQVKLLGWGAHLDPWPWTGEDGGARGDVAEAILIGVGAARHAHLAPKGPDPRRSPTWRPAL